MTLVLLLLALAVAPEGSTATPEAIAAARARADALIAEANASDLLENITASDEPTVRHGPSGLICRFYKGDARIVIDRDPKPGGFEIACDESHNGMQWTVFATRAKDAVAANGMVELPGSDLHGIDHARLKPYRGEYADVSGALEDRPVKPAPHRSARFIGRRGGQKVLVRASMAKVGDWFIQERTTAPIELAIPADVGGEFVISRALSDLANPPARSE